MLSRKHYKAIAEVLAEVERDAIFMGWDSEKTLIEIRKRLGTYFKSDNYRFDRGRFETASRSDLSWEVNNA